ncbi:MAG: radical SAM/SPASM domain-containing protein [Promethearchaeota archaeon]
MVVKAGRIGYLKNFFNKIDPYISNVVFSVILRKPRSYPSMIRLAKSYLTARSIREKHLIEGIKVPPVLIMGVTSSCNLSCSGCYAAATGTLSMENTSKMLKLYDWKKIIDEATKLGVFGFIIAGGEPFLVPKILSICSTFKDRIFAFFTNGTVLKSKDIEKLKKVHNAVVMVSVEGDQVLTNDRRGRGVYEKAINTLALLKKNKVVSGISITINKLNYKYWMEEKNLNLLVANGIKLVFFLEYVPINQDTELMLAQNERKSFRDKILEYRRTKNILILHSPGDEELKGGCVSAGRSFAYITPKGDLTPCPVSNIATHNLMMSSLKNGLKSSLFTLIREQDYLLETGNSPCALFSHQKEVQEIVKKVNGYYTCL